MIYIYIQYFANFEHEQPIHDSRSHTEPKQLLVQIYMLSES